MAKAESSRGSRRRAGRRENARSLEAAAGRPAETKHILKLYVAGVNSRSSRAIRTITEICDEYLEGRYELRIIDIYQQPTLARGEQIIAAPTLVKKLPLPLRRIIGDMANKEKVLVGLDLKPVP
jgi:circadian clock protein KaiB